MNNERNVKTSKMPRYQSHKQVHALKIAGIEIHQDQSATIAPKESGVSAFKTLPGWAARFSGSENDLGYFVVYKDGFTSWSPTEAFEDGYSRVTDQDTWETGL